MRCAVNPRGVSYVHVLHRASGDASTRHELTGTSRFFSAPRRGRPL